MVQGVVFQCHSSRVPGSTQNSGHCLCGVGLACSLSLSGFLKGSPVSSYFLIPAGRQTGSRKIGPRCECVCVWFHVTR